MYKIYINEKPLLIADLEEKAADLLLQNTTSYESDGFVLNKNAIVQLSERKVIFTKNKEQVFANFAAQFNRIDAAGGIVCNENGDYLFIFRRGKWDLPKGKLDAGEDDATAAIREVQEECGLKEISLGKLFYVSWHVYFEKSNWILKKSTWFRMKTKEMNLTAQSEEDITDIRWIAKENFAMVRQNTFATILDILDEIEKKGIKNLE